MSELVVHNKRKPFDVYIGRPSKSVCLKIFGQPSETFRIVVQHPNSRITSATKGAPELSGKVVVIPAQVGGGSTPSASLFEHDIPASSISTLVQLGTLISVFAASPSTTLSAADVNGATMGTDSGPLFHVNLGKPMPPSFGLGAGNENPLTQEAIVASDTEPPRSKWLVTAFSSAEIRAFRSGDGSHSKHYIESVVYSPFKWGNPFEIGKDGTREEVIAKYQIWLYRQPELMEALPELKGKILGCWCAPKACHGDVLADLAANV